MNRRKHNKIWASTPPLLIQHFHSITRQWTLSWKLETIITRLLWQPEEITETVFTLIFRVFSSNSEKAETSRGWFRSIDLWVMGPARFRCATLLYNLRLLLIIPLTVLGSTPLTLENCKGGGGEGYLFLYFGYKMGTVWINVATRIRENKE